MKKCTKRKIFIDIFGYFGGRGTPTPNSQQTNVVGIKICSTEIVFPPFSILMLVSIAASNEKSGFAIFVFSESGVYIDFDVVDLRLSSSFFFEGHGDKKVINYFRRRRLTEVTITLIILNPRNSESSIETSVDYESN